jgi:hypothetical protein
VKKEKAWQRGDNGASIGLQGRHIVHGVKISEILNVGPTTSRHSGADRLPGRMRGRRKVQVGSHEADKDVSARYRTPALPRLHIAPWRAPGGWLRFRNHIWGLGTFGSTATLRVEWTQVAAQEEGTVSARREFRGSGVA